MAGVGKVQLDNLPRRERRWGLCVTEREGIRLQMAADGGGDRMEEGN